MDTPLLLQAFKGTNKKIPVWFMRQAGRYLPEYQAIRKEHSLEEMFQTPEIAAEVTCLPIDILNVDAAILFADILTLPALMGFNIHFSKENGPVIGNPLRQASDINRIHAAEDFSRVAKTIQLCRKKLPKHIPLIGFAGAPFTVLSYLIEGGSSVSFTKTLKLMQSDPVFFHKAMVLLTESTILYLNAQKKAGIQVFQLFDTWGGILRDQDYRQYVLPHVWKIFAAVNLPSIYYLKNSAHLLEAMTQCGAGFLSVCETVNLKSNAILEDCGKGIQGNFYNGLLYADLPVIKKEVKALLKVAQPYPCQRIRATAGSVANEQPYWFVRIILSVYRTRQQEQAVRQSSHDRSHDFLSSIKHQD